MSSMMLFVCKYCRETFETILELKCHKRNLHRDDIIARRTRISLKTEPISMSKDVKFNSLEKIRKKNENDLYVVGNMTNGISSVTELFSYPSVESIWYQCPECQVLLENIGKFLYHREGHRLAPACLFMTSNGIPITIEKLTMPEIFIPRISITPVESSCCKFERKFYSLQIQLTSLTETEIIRLMRVTSLRLRKSKSRFSTCCGNNEGEVDSNRRFEDAGYDYFDHVESDGDDNDEEYILLKSAYSKKCKRKRQRLENQTTNTASEVVLPQNGAPKKPKRIPPKFICKICMPSVSFGTHIDPYRIHMKNFHLKEGSYYECPICSYKVQGKEPLKKINRHMSSWHEYVFNPAGFNCDICEPSIKFEQFYQLKLHVKDMHCVNGVYECPSCDEKTTSIQLMYRHLRRHHKAKPAETVKTKLVCPHCPKIFRYPNIFKLHVQRHKRLQESFRTKKYRCTACSIGFQMKDHLVRHLYLHQEDNPFTCKVCNRKNTSKDHLHRHVSAHLGIKRPRKSICEHCGSIHMSLQSLKKHIIEFHPDKSIRIFEPTPRLEQLTMEGMILKVFGKPQEDSSLESSIPKIVEKMIQDAKENSKIKSENGIIRIGRTFTPETSDLYEINPAYNSKRCHTNFGVLDSYPCKFCKFVSFRRAYLLRQHLKNYHPKEYALEEAASAAAFRFICGSCGFHSDNTQELANHTASAHPSIKRFHCGLCGIKVDTQVHLDRHVDIIHNVKKTIICEICKKKYATEKKLRHHQKCYCKDETKDSSELICKICKSQTRSRRAFHAHMRLHSESRKLSICAVCQETCSCKSSLRRHIRLVHGNGIYQLNKDKKIKRAKLPLHPIPEADLFL